jgi:hypothetical protein
MCFSATASFAAGGALTAAGIGILRRARTRERIPIASIPLLFGLQQLVEGVVWMSFDKPVLHLVATYFFTFFSHVLWPFYLPLAVYLNETGPKRKKALKWFVVFGVSVSIYMIYYILRGPVSSEIVQNCIYYSIPYSDSYLLLLAYVIATCACCFISSHKYIRTFGLAVFGGLMISLWSYRFAFYSVWCYFAAILSLIIYVHLGPRKQLQQMADKMKTEFPKYIPKWPPVDQKPQ